jgi:hypothetical protein
LLAWAFYLRSTQAPLSPLSLEQAELIVDDLRSLQARRSEQGTGRGQWHYYTPVHYALSLLRDLVEGRQRTSLTAICRVGLDFHRYHAVGLGWAPAALGVAAPRSAYQVERDSAELPLLLDLA